MLFGHPPRNVKALKDGQFVRFVAILMHVLEMLKLLNCGSLCIRIILLIKFL